MVAVVAVLVVTALHLLGLGHPPLAVAVVAHFRVRAEVAALEVVLAATAVAVLVALEHQVKATTAVAQTELPVLVALEAGVLALLGGMAGLIAEPLALEVPQKVVMVLSGSTALTMLAEVVAAGKVQTPAIPLPAVLVEVVLAALATAPARVWLLEAMEPQTLVAAAEQVNLPMPEAADQEL